MVLGIALAIATYFGAYFASVRGVYYKSEHSVTPWPEYVPLDARFIQWLFAPAHFVDATFLRPKRWQPI